MHQRTAAGLTIIRVAISPEARARPSASRDDHLEDVAFYCDSRCGDILRPTRVPPIERRRAQAKRSCPVREVNDAEDVVQRARHTAWREDGLSLAKIHLASLPTYGGRGSGRAMLKLSRFLFWSAATFAFFMAVLPQPPQVSGLPADKILHVLAFASLALLGTAAYPRLSPLDHVIRLSAFGGIIELIQLIPYLHRDAEVMDWIADTAAVVPIVLVFHLWRRRPVVES